MAGCAAAWELSRGDWKRRHRSITVLEQSAALGGKGASTRGDDARILEHGLHVWLGYYDNAFRLVRDVYDELDRITNDPQAPIRTWRDAFVAAPDIGVFEHDGERAVPWLASFPLNEQTPGEPSDLSFADLVDRGFDLAATAVRSGLDARRAAVLVDLVSTLLRGMTADGLLHHPGGFDRIDGEDFRAWLRRHGARDETLTCGLVRGMYDLVFAYRSGDRAAPAFSAGLGVFLAVRMFFDYKGSVFWKMTAGMGDVVFAPLHEALMLRGVDVRLGHVVDGLDLEGDRVVRVHVGVDEYVDGSLARVDDLSVYQHTDRPIGATAHRTLEVGHDFDSLVLAASVASLESIVGTLADRPPWRTMLADVATVATWAVQLWLRPGESDLGGIAGGTLSALEAPLDTTASMTHLLERERWVDDPPRSLYYLCASTPDRDPDGEDVDIEAQVNEHLAMSGSTIWPAAAVTDLAHRSVRAHYSVRHDEGSARYVQSLPGTGASRLRVDESGVDNLVLAGDWTDCGLNAGCIEAAVISGVEAAAAVEGRPLTDRILGPLTWDFR